MANIELEHVTKRFGETCAINDLDIEIGDGEFFVLLGATGAGKTTSLRLVAGLERADAGSVRIDGTDVTGAPPAARDVTFVFQQYSLYPNYTVFENLAFPLKAPGRRVPAAEIRERAQWVGERLGITSKFGNRATALSGGEMQRVALGRALMRQPAVHLMDEPLSSLDAKLRESLRRELKTLQAELGATLFYVTHDQSEALALADRIGILERGRLLQVGSPEDIYRRPNSVAVARQLGSPAINLLDCDTLGVNAPCEKATLGLRPEDIVLSQANADFDGPTGVVRQLEELGAENTVVLDFRDTSLNVLTPPGEQLTRGDRVGVVFRPEDLLVFDAQGQRLDRPVSAA